MRTYNSIKGKYTFKPKLRRESGYPQLTALDWYKAVYEFTDKNYARLSGAQSLITNAQKALDDFATALSAVPDSNSVIDSVHEIRATLDDIYAAEEIATDNILALIPKLEVQFASGAIYPQSKVGQVGF